MLSKSLYGILATFAGAMLLFLAGFAGWQLGLAWLATGFYYLASKAIWLAFGLLLLLQLGWLIQAFYKEMLLYFRQDRRLLRRIAMLQLSHRNAKQRLASEKRQMLYWNRLKHQRLLTANDKKHNGKLFKAIDRELTQSTSPNAYKHLSKTLKQHHKRADSQSMLALREQTACR